MGMHRVSDIYWIQMNKATNEGPKRSRRYGEERTWREKNAARINNDVRPQQRRHWQATRNQNKLNYSITSWRRTFAALYLYCVLKLKWILNAQDDYDIRQAMMWRAKTYRQKWFVHSEIVWRIFNAQWILFFLFPFVLFCFFLCLLYIR